MGQDDGRRVLDSVICSCSWTLLPSSLSSKLYLPFPPVPEDGEAGMVERTQLMLLAVLFHFCATRYISQYTHVAVSKSTLHQKKKGLGTNLVPSPFLFGDEVAGAVRGHGVWT